MNVRQRVAAFLAAVALAIVAGCTQPSGPGAPAVTSQPAASPQPAASQAPSSPGRGDY